jgi:hypothetical protein
MCSKAGYKIHVRLILKINDNGWRREKREKESELRNTRRFGRR